MGWKRGIIIGIIIFIILTLVKSSCPMSIGVSQPPPAVCDGLESIGIFRLGGGTLYSWILSPIVYIILGLLIDFIITKIKPNRKKSR